LAAFGEEVLFNLNDGTPKLLFVDAEYKV